MASVVQATRCILRGGVPPLSLLRPRVCGAASVFVSAHIQAPAQPRSAAPARTYVNTGVPAITLADVAHFASRKRTSVVHRGERVLYRLAPEDTRACVIARKTGFLALTHAATGVALNYYLKYCCEDKRPYMVLSRDGCTLTVDVATVRGVRAGAPVPANSSALLRQREFDAAVQALQKIVRDTPGVQVSLPSEVRAHALSVTSTNEGVDASKPRHTHTHVGQGPVELYVSDRGAGMALASALFNAFCTSAGRPTVLDRERAREAVLSARRGGRVERLMRRVTRLAADGVRVKNLRVKAGALDGFMAAEAAGTTSQIVDAYVRARTIADAAENTRRRERKPLPDAPAVAALRASQRAAAAAAKSASAPAAAGR